MGTQTPALPHQPQAHFYGAPDLDMTTAPQSGMMKAGEKGYFFGFDSLPGAPGYSHNTDNVILTGYEGGLEVYSVGKKGLESVARLRGLRGGVHYAKILPWKVDADFDENLFPLVAVVVNGPVLASTNDNSMGSALQSANASPRPDGGTTSPRSVFADGGLRSMPTAEFYQTCVHVYSLKSSKLVDTILMSPKIPADPGIPLTSSAFKPPAPSGAFTIKADAGTLAVCSGVTGECWIYLQLPEVRNNHMFACVGKLWTCLQQSWRADPAAEETDKASSPSSTSRFNPQTPIFALNGRWIAYCPSLPSSQIMLKAHIPVPILGKSSTVTSATSPQVPPSTSTLDVPPDSVVNKLMRGATQELISSANWLGKQGMQAWNAYWNRPNSPQAQQTARSPPQGLFGGRSPQNDINNFPPTHGSSAPAAPKDPGLVSIVDAESLAHNTSVHPLTTFHLPFGCSYLSFSPTAMALFTVSSKGDVQTVWDLFRLQYTKSSPLQATQPNRESSGPQVRQIANFTRMTVARVVDVVWTEPLGERIAMVTERGTIHLLDMPPGAFMWPPMRRRTTEQESTAEAVEQGGGGAVSLASGAIGAAYQAAKPLITRPRRSSGNTAAVAGNSFKESAAQGGRVIASTISSSLGKTGTAINQLRHNGENRLSLPPSGYLPLTGCVKWSKGRRSQTLVSAAGGVVRSFPSKSRQTSTQSRTWLGRGNQYKDFKIPSIPDDKVAPAIRQITEHGAVDEYLDLNDQDTEGANTLTLKRHSKSKSHDYSAETSIPQAEIESSAPYQPFHTDRRVMLSEYTWQTMDQIDSTSVLLGRVSLDGNATPKNKKKNALPAQKSDLSAAPTSSAWAFGQDIPAVQLDLGLPMGSEDPLANSRALPASAMERVLQYGESGEQIVVTTRRRRGAQTAEGEDGFFEDDCEVLDFADQRV